MSGLSQQCLDAMDEVTQAEVAVAAADADLSVAQRDLDVADDAMDNPWKNRLVYMHCLATSGFGPVGVTSCTMQYGDNQENDRQAQETARQSWQKAAEAKEKANSDLRNALAKRRSACKQHGCGSRGGRGYRRGDGKCAGWHDWGSGDDDDD